MPTNAYHPSGDPLAALTPQQRDGLAYLADGWGDVRIAVQLRPDDGCAVVFGGEGPGQRAAVLAPNGDFLDPTAMPDQATVTYAYNDYKQYVDSPTGYDPNSN